MGELAPELSETSTSVRDVRERQPAINEWPHHALIVLKFLASTLNLFPPSLPVGSNTKENPGKQLKDHEEPEDKNHTSIILAQFWI